MSEKIRKEKILKLFRTMVKIRLCEESLVEPILNGRIKTPCHLYTGEEAIAAGICEALKPEDYIFGGHRSHGHYLAKGGDMLAMVSEIFCKENGCSKGRGGSMHIVDPNVGMMGSAPIVAGTISLAMGSALASKIRKDKRVAVCFFGDGATGEGVLYESMNFSAIKNLPLIFACENNLYSTHLSISECRPNRPIYEIALPFGIRSKSIDGNDVLEVFNVAKEAVSVCRRGEGPVFLELKTYRLRGHVGPDDNIQGQHTDIRPKEEIEIWKSRDPILRIEKYIEEKDIASKNQLKIIREEAKKEVMDVYKHVVKSANPKKEELERYVFAEKT